MPLRSGILTSPFETFRESFSMGDVRECGASRSLCLLSRGAQTPRHALLCCTAGGPLGGVMAVWCGENAKEPEPCSIPGRSTVLHFYCFTHFSKIFLHTFSFGLYNTATRMIG